VAEKIYRCGFGHGLIPVAQGGRAPKGEKSRIENEKSRPEKGLGLKGRAR
jgi:hypothetical protein